MFLPEEIFKSRRHLTHKPSGGLLLFEPRYGSAWKSASDPSSSAQSSRVRRRWRDAVWEITRRLGDETTIHGLDKLGSKSVNKRERTLWMVAFVVALIICIYVIIVIAKRFSKQQLHTVIDNTKYPTYKIDFPEVTICNHNRLNWQRFADAEKRFLREEDRTQDKRELFSRVMARYDNLSMGNFDNFADLGSRSQLEPLNYVNFTNVVGFMSWRCDEILFNCTWRHRPMNCCDIFFTRHSQFGQCLAFNTIQSAGGQRMQRMDPKWPWRYGKYGPESALTLIVHLREDLHYPGYQNEKGLTMMLTEPSVYFNYPIEVAKNTITKVSINGMKQTYDNGTRSTPVSLRSCLFEDETDNFYYKTLRGHRYNLENCQSECQQEYLMKFCNCTVDLFYLPDKYPPCKLVDLPCLAKYNENLNYMSQEGEDKFVTTNAKSIRCDCFMNCDSLTLISDVRSTKLEHLDTKDSSVQLDLYFRRNYILAYRTSLIYTWVDLMASFGGIVGLFIGCSLVSLVELAYIILVDIPQWLLEQHRELMQLKHKQQKLQHSVRQVLSPGYHEQAY